MALSANYTTTSVRAEASTGHCPWESSLQSAASISSTVAPSKAVS